MIKIWLICIFKMAAKMAEIYIKRHIFLSSVHSFDCIGFKYISAWALLSNMQIWIICIFKMAAKMADLFYGQHILLSEVNSFYCMALKVSYLLQLEFFMKLCKFSSFAYSKWLPTWPKSARNTMFSSLKSTGFSAGVDTLSLCHARYFSLAVQR